MNKTEIVKKARAAKTVMMLNLLAMSETEQEVSEMQAAIHKLDAMSDSEFLRYHGVNARD